MRTSGTALILLYCLSLAGCHRLCHQHNACVDRHQWNKYENDPSPWNDWGPADNCYRRPPVCPPPSNCTFAPPVYTPPVNQCGCETSYPTVMNEQWHSDFGSMPMSSGCSTCGDSAMMMTPTYSSPPVYSTFDSQPLNLAPTPSPAPPSEYYNPQATPAAPTPAVPTPADSAALPTLGAPTAF